VSDAELGQDNLALVETDFAERRVATIGEVEDRKTCGVCPSELGRLVSSPD